MIGGHNNTGQYTSIVLFDVTNSSNPSITQQLPVPASAVYAIQQLDDCGVYSAASQNSFIITTLFEALNPGANAVRR